MGVVASNFQGDDGSIVGEIAQPTSDDWISKHAEACRMPETQVRKLWEAFKDLGGDESGQLPQNVIVNVRNADSSSLFLEKILKQFPTTKNGGVTFQTYCNATKWFSDGTTETRIRGAFRVLNNGYPLTEAILVEILREIYSDTSEAVIKRTAQVFLEEVDVKGRGSIDEKDFVSWVQKMPADVVEQIMKFDVLPSSQAGGGHPQESSDPNRPSTQTLRQVAAQTKTRDWLLLVNKLGFTEEEIKEVGDSLGDRKDDELLFELLKTWGEKTDAVVTVATLKEALVSCSMGDVAETLK
ncbi:uncharacterized protein [Diadema antillarum]|uniref:uncharacterized protein n=1 Tax=Diadema antillarum TaxID=105358 RepID=UPI003A8A0F12